MEVMSFAERLQEELELKVQTCACGECVRSFYIRTPEVEKDLMDPCPVCKTKLSFKKK